MGRILLPRQQLRPGGLETMGSRIDGCEVESLVTKFVVGSLLCRIQIGVDLLPIFLVVIWDHIRAGHSYHLQAKDACHLLLIKKIGIAEFLEPGEIVEDTPRCWRNAV